MASSDSFTQFIQTISIEFIPFMIAVVFHEFAHGFVANLWGDGTAKEHGRLTLNPVPHIDPLGTIVMPLLTFMGGVGIAWAKPVPIDPRRFRKLRPGLFSVSIAGVAMNAALALVGAMFFCILLKWVPDTFYLAEPLERMSIALVRWNVMLAVFNLLPLPPLDGSKIIESFLPPKAAMRFESLTKFSFFIFLALWISGAFRYLGYPIAYCTDKTLRLMVWLFNVPL